MPHTYAHLGEFKNFLRDGGSADLGTVNDDALLLVLEGASRAVDDFCDRSSFGSGFGPRTATNRYDSDGSDELNLRDDFLSISSVTVYAGTGGASSALVENTDYYARPYGRDQKRELLIHNLTSGHFSAGYRTIDVAGVAGYANTTRTATATAGAIASTTVTTFTIGGTDDLQIGMTLLIDSEQVYLRAKSGTTATIDRAQNGTTAATHSAGATIAYYLYDRRVKNGTLLVAQRRWRARDAGLVPDFGGGALPVASHRDSEWSLLRSVVGNLKIYGAA